MCRSFLRISAKRQAPREQTIPAVESVGGSLEGGAWEGGNKLHLLQRPAFGFAHGGTDEEEGQQREQRIERVGTTHPADEEDEAEVMTGVGGGHVMTGDRISQFETRYQTRNVTSKAILRALFVG